MGANDTRCIEERQYHLYQILSGGRATFCIAMQKPHRSPPTPLRTAREAAGYPTLAAFAKAYGLTETTLRSYDNGTRPLPRHKAKQFAKLLEPRVPGISWLHLIGEETFDGIQSELTENKILKPSIDDRLSQVEVPEYNSRVIVKGGFRITDGTKKDAWVFSRRYLADELHLPVQNLAVFEVVGDSMAPTLCSGDRVLVNMSDKQIAQPGVFVLWEHGAPVAKRIEALPDTKPLKLVRISDNPKHEPREALAERTEIIGRVVWYARRL